MRKTTLAVMAIAVLLVGGAIYASASSQETAATCGESTCNGECGGNCGIEGCGCASTCGAATCNQECKGSCGISSCGCGA